MTKQSLFPLIIGMVVGAVVCVLLFFPDVEESTDTKTNTTETVTETKTDTVFVEKIVADTVFVKPDVRIVSDQDSIKHSKATYSNAQIGLVANMYHTGNIVDVNFEYIQKTRLVRQTTNLRIIERETSTITTITRTIKPPPLSLSASTVLSPSVLGVTGGVQYHSLGIQAGKDFVNNEPMVIITINFSPSNLIKRIF